ncbi:MAG: HNH endonuclease signature motif containing protein [Anaerolineae bacterium]
MDRSEAGKKGYEKTKDRIRQHLDAKAQRAIAEYESNPKFCLFCGEKIPCEKRVNKFCSQSCAASYNNRGLNRHGKTIKPVSFCSCGKPKLPQNKYCAECIEKRVFQKVYDTAKLKSDKTRKKLLLEQRGHICEGCGLAEWRGYPIPLDLHHIDGNSDNNAENNLQLLCPNCHALTGTHKRRNKNGKRQQQRRQRYAEGKTW